MIGAAELEGKKTERKKNTQRVSLKRLLSLLHIHSTYDEREQLIAFRN